MTLTNYLTIAGIVLLAWVISQIIRQHEKPRKFKGINRDCK
jgi:hypothetical protein